MSAETILYRLDFPLSGYGEWTGDGVGIWWLGQAGFLLRFQDTTIVIDAYLSDVLAAKYKGQEYAHTRMMPPPIAMEQLTGIDYFISSHSHSDHLDPGLIPVVRDNNPACRFIMPEAARNIGLERGVPEESLIGVDAGSEMSLAENIAVSFIPSAHEELKKDENGHYSFLGFIFRFGGMKIYHPGDCLPYTGLDDWLEPHRIDLALMPVNGRREELSQRGIAGNFDFTQARELVDRHEIRYMIPHHYGMFDFNTLERSDLHRQISETGAAEYVFPAETGTMYNLTERA